MNPLMLTMGFVGDLALICINVGPVIIGFTMPRSLLTAADEVIE